MPKTIRTAKELDATRISSRVGSTLKKDPIFENIYCNRDDRLMTPSVVEAGARKNIVYTCYECGLQINPKADKRKHAIIITSSDGHTLNPKDPSNNKRTLTVQRGRERLLRPHGSGNKETSVDYDKLTYGHGSIHVTDTQIDVVDKRSSIGRVLIIR